jgi:multidrug resistance efflux pump
MRRAQSALSIAGLLLLAVPAGAQPTPAKPSKVLTVGAARSGIIQSILVADGAHVDKGQILVQLDCRPLQREIEFRTASLAEAEAAYERIRNGPRSEEIEIGEANVGVAEARAEEADAALGRADALQMNVTITRAQLLAVQRDSRVADALLVDARKRLALLKAGSRPEDIAEAKARREAAAANLEEGNAELDECSVRAPAAGTIQLVSTVGQFVSTFAPTPIAEITSDAQVQ